MSQRAGRGGGQHRHPQPGYCMVLPHAAGRRVGGVAIDIGALRAVWLVAMVEGVDNIAILLREHPALQNLKFSFFFFFGVRLFLPGSRERRMGTISYFILASTGI